MQGPMATCAETGDSSSGGRNAESGSDPGAEAFHMDSAEMEEDIARAVSEAKLGELDEVESFIESFKEE